MSAETLRRAASLLRERASTEPERTIFDPRVRGVWLNSAHYLTMTPAVALAVADGLDAEAASHHPHAWDADRFDCALAVARVYLGESA